jgi:hypothetical protein
MISSMIDNVCHSISLTGGTLKRDRRRELRDRLRKEFTSPRSGITFLLRSMHESDLIGILNEIGSLPYPGVERSHSDPESALARAEAVYHEVCRDAAQDLRALGLAPTTIMVHAYQHRVGTWSKLRKVDEAPLPSLVRKMTLGATEECKRYLPTPSSSRRSSIKGSAIALAEGQFKCWTSAIRDILRAQLRHREALGQRQNYIALRRSRSLPSRDVFYTCYLGLSAGLINDGGTIDRQRHEMILGSSAAESSRWNLRAIAFHLDEFDLELNPKGTYSSLRGEPKQLGVWKEIASRLKGCLPTSLSEFGRAKAIAAAMLTYAGPPTFAAESVVSFAKDTVQKWLIEGGYQGEPF